MENIKTINPLQLPSLPLSERLQLPDCWAVYFVISGEKVIYIGKAEGLKGRWSGHNKASEINLRGFSDIRIAWLEILDRDLLNASEKALIRYFRPVLNNRGLAETVQFQAQIHKGLDVLFRRVIIIKTGKTLISKFATEALVGWLKLPEHQAIIENHKLIDGLKNFLTSEEMKEFENLLKDQD